MNHKDAQTAEELENNKEETQITEVSQDSFKESVNSPFLFASNETSSCTLRCYSNSVCRIFYFLQNLVLIVLLKASKLSLEVNVLIGVMCSIIAGFLMSIQGVFNTRLTEKIGLSAAGVIIQGTGLVLSLVVLMFYKDGSFKRLTEVNKLYLTGGLIGVAIVYTVVLGMKSLGPACAVAVILVAQLLAAAGIELFGLFDTKHVCFHMSKLAGLLLMIAGIIVFKLKG